MAKAKKTEVMEAVVKAESKFKIGDEVVYLDAMNIRRDGIIDKIEWTQPLPWNPVSEPLYDILGYPYLRNEEQIVKKYDEHGVVKIYDAK